MPFPHEVSSGKEDYGTPWNLFEFFDLQVNFDLDAAANPENRKVARYFGPGGLVEDALDPTVRWSKFGRRIWLNFPYRRQTNGTWMERVYQESRYCDTLIWVCCFTRHDARWWMNAAPKSDTVFPLYPRVQFEGAAHGAMVPASVVLFTPWSEGPPRVQWTRWKS